MADKSYQINFDGYWREPNTSSLPTYSGVYCVYTCIQDVLHNRASLVRLIYIGEAGDVRHRVTSHEGWDAWRTYLRKGEEICFSTAPVDSTDRPRGEAALIHHHQPPANTEYKTTFPFDPTTIQTAGNNALLTVFFTVRSTELESPGRFFR